MPFRFSWQPFQAAKLVLALGRKGSKDQAKAFVQLTQNQNNSVLKIIVKKGIEQYGYIWACKKVEGKSH